MAQESTYSPDRDPERRRDLEWLEENRALLWLTSTVAFEEIGYGAVVVNLTEEPEGTGESFGYYTEDELLPEHEELRPLLQEYDPDRQFIIMLLKAGGRADIYVNARPLMGWYADMRSQTPYPQLLREQSSY